MLPERELELEFWSSEHFENDPFCRGILLWREQVVYLSSLNRCLLETSTGESEELPINEVWHLLCPVHARHD